MCRKTETAADMLMTSAAVCEFRDRTGESAGPGGEDHFTFW